MNPQIKQRIEQIKNEEVPAEYKKTAVGIFPKRWSTKKFYDVVSIVNGQVDPKKEPYASMPHIGPGNIGSMTGEIKNYRTAREDGQISGKYLFGNNHVIFGKIRPELGKIAYPRFDGICSADMYAFSPYKEYLTPFYLYYLLFNRRFYQYTVSVSKRTGMPKVNRNDLAGYRFIIPSLPIHH